MSHVKNRQRFKNRPFTGKTVNSSTQKPAEVISFLQKRGLCDSIENYLAEILDNEWISKKEHGIISEQLMALNEIIPNVDNEHIEIVRTEATHAPRGKHQIKDDELTLWRKNQSLEINTIPGIDIENALVAFHWNEDDDTDIKNRLVSLNPEIEIPKVKEQYSAVLSQGLSYFVNAVKMYRLQYEDSIDNDDDIIIEDIDLT